MAEPDDGPSVSLPPSVLRSIYERLDSFSDSIQDIRTQVGDSSRKLDQVLETIGTLRTELALHEETEEERLAALEQRTAS